MPAAFSDRENSALSCMTLKLEEDNNGSEIGDEPQGMIKSSYFSQLPSNIVRA